MHCNVRIIDIGRFGNLGSPKENLRKRKILATRRTTNWHTLPLVDTARDGVFQAAVKNQDRFLPASNGPMKREQRSLSLNFQTHGAALSSSVLPTIKLATQTEKYEVRNGRLSRTVLASN